LETLQLCRRERVASLTRGQLLSAADSTGQRNGLAEHLSRRLEAERLSRPFVQLSRQSVQLRLYVARAVDALWQVLPEQLSLVFLALGKISFCRLEARRSKRVRAVASASGVV
jgi:hypothetical protein